MDAGKRWFSFVGDPDLLIHGVKVTTPPTYVCAYRSCRWENLILNPPSLLACNRYRSLEHPACTGYGRRILPILSLSALIISALGIHSCPATVSLIPHAC